MLVERGLRVMNVEVVGEAYAIASNYLRKSGAIPDNLATNERLLEIIVRCSSAANSTGSGSPTRRSPSSKPPAIIDLITQPENFMEAAIDRIMQTYDLLLNRTAAASDEARAKVTEYVTTLIEAGEKDTHRLTVCGLTYLRQLDGSTDPVKAGFTGL